MDALSAAVGRIDPAVRCAGYEYPLIATGERDFALYWRTLIWDHAPGALVLSEAGGCVIHLDGARYDPLTPRSGLIVAYDPSVAETLLKLTRSQQWEPTSWAGVERYRTVTRICL